MSKTARPKFRKEILNNGVTLLMERHAYVRGVSLGIWIRVGSRYEAPKVNGISHFIEHMVFKGTQTKNALELATALEAVGGDLNAFTDREFTCYHATVLKEDANIALEVLSDLVVRPTFPSKEIEREKKILFQEMSMAEDTPDDWILTLFFRNVWKGQALGLPILGSKSTVTDFTRSKVLSFYRKYYRPENIFVSVAGNFEFQQIIKEAKKRFIFDSASKSKGKAFSLPGVEFTPKQKSVVMNTEQLHYLLGFNGPGYKSQSRFDALVLSFHLGGGMSSRLFQEIREKAALAYTVDCDCFPFADTGIFSFYVALNSRSLKPCVDILRKEIERVKQRELTKSELKMAKGQVRGAILLSSDQMEARQESMGRNEIIFGRYISVEEVIDEIDSVTAERVKEFTNGLFVAENQAAITLGKKKLKSQSLSVC